MRRLFFGALIVACAPASAQISCDNSSSINCDFDARYGWIIRGSAPRRVEPDPPPPSSIQEPLALPPGRVKSAIESLPASPERIAQLERMIERHRVVLARWDQRQGLPSESPALYGELINMEREAEANITQSLLPTGRLPPDIRAWVLLMNYKAGIAYWEQGVEASVSGVDPDAARQLLTQAAGRLTWAAGGLVGVPTTEYTNAAREFGAFWMRADELRELQLAATARDCGVVATGPFAQAHWTKAASTYAGQAEPAFYDLVGNARRIEGLVRAKSKPLTPKPPAN
jgi:hypothetical protein